MTPTQTERIVAFIKAHPGCTTMELTLGLAPFCANPRARISDARAQGFDVRCERRSDGRLGYRVVEMAPVTRGEQVSAW